MNYETLQQTDCNGTQARADSESFARQGPTLSTFAVLFFQLRGSKYHLKGSYHRPVVSLAGLWWLNIECWLQVGSFVIFQRGVRTRCLPLDPQRTSKEWVEKSPKCEVWFPDVINPLVSFSFPVQIFRNFLQWEVVYKKLNTRIRSLYVNTQFIPS